LDPSDANKRQRSAPQQKSGNTGSSKDTPKPADKKPSAAEEASKKMGLLCFDGTPKTLPYINIRAKKTATAKTKEQLCVYFLTQGWSCAQGRECKRPHIAKLDQLDATTRERFIQFIADTKNKYSWAPGKEPTPGNN
jgi:hypothetical protein